MAIFTYTAKDPDFLVTGHLIDEQYTLDIGLQVHRRSIVGFKKIHTSRSRKVTEVVIKGVILNIK